MNKLKISGFHDNKRVVDAEYKRIQDGVNICRGYNLDEINLNVKIKDKLDIANLINLLHVLTPCFDYGNE